MSWFIFVARVPLEFSYFCLETLPFFHTSGLTLWPMVGKNLFLRMMTDILTGHSPALLGCVSR